MAMSHLGRKLSSDEVVHHIDGDKLNNSWENLEVVSRSEHAREHKDVFRELLGLRKRVEALERIVKTLSTPGTAMSFA